VVSYSPVLIEINASGGVRGHEHFHDLDRDHSLCRAGLLVGIGRHGDPRPKAGAAIHCRACPPPIEVALIRALDESLPGDASPQAALGNYS